MPVESATYINQLNPSYPDGTEPKSDGDNHIRLHKQVHVNSFPNVGGAVTVTHTELNSVPNRALKAGDTYTGTHAFAGATAVTVPTVATADNSTNAASTAMVQAAIAAVNSALNLSYSSSSAASFSVSEGQVVVATNTGAVAVTFPASPTTGAVCGVHFDNTRIDNTVDLGANSVIGWNGVIVSGLITCDQKFPVVLRWGGDYWRNV